RNLWNDAKENRNFEGNCSNCNSKFHSTGQCKNTGNRNVLPKTRANRVCIRPVPSPLEDVEELCYDVMENVMQPNIMSSNINKVKPVVIDKPYHGVILNEDSNDECTRILGGNPFVKLRCGSHVIKARIDSGADHSLVNKDLIPDDLLSND